MKKVPGVCGVIAAMAVGGSSAYAAPAPSGGGCRLDGQAKFSRPLTVNQPSPVVNPPSSVPPTGYPLGLDWGGVPFSYSFDGDLTGCQALTSAGPDATAPADGRIYAGEPLKIGQTTYDWPFAKPQGNGGCTGSFTSGTSVVAWGDGSVSIIDYSTSGALAAIGLTGNFRTGSFTFASADKNDDGSPVSTKTVQLRYGSDYVGGPLVFEPADPTACNGAGVPDAAIQGALAQGYLQVG